MINNKLIACIAFLAALPSACSPQTRETKVSDINNSPFPSAFFLHEPGSILDNYLTVDTLHNGKRLSLIALSSCKLVAAKFTDSGLHIVVFDGAFHAKPNSAAVLLTIKSISGDPTIKDAKELKNNGFTITECKT